MTVKRLNRHPFNALCERLLKQAKQDVNPEYLASLQLAEWFLQQPPAAQQSPLNGFRESLLEQVQLMYGWGEPERAQHLLTNYPEQDVLAASLQQEKDLRNLEPWQAGAVLVENLQGNLAEHNRAFEPRLADSG